MTILEKIRAEIEKEYNKYRNMSEKWDERACGIGTALEIIDKYAGQESCDDVVSRKAVLDGIEELKQSPWATDKRGNGFEYLITEALDIVADLCVKQEPSVRPQEPKTEQWQELKETITELRDNDGTATQQEVCRFLVNLMEILEKQMVEPQESEDKE